MPKRSTNLPSPMVGERLMEHIGGLPGANPARKDRPTTVNPRSPQARHLALYCMGGTTEAQAEILGRLGPHRAGSGCVYVTRLDRVDEGVLRELFEASLARLAATYDGA